MFSSFPPRTQKCTIWLPHFKKFILQVFVTFFFVFSRPKFFFTLHFSFHHLAVFSELFDSAAACFVPSLEPSLEVYFVRVDSEPDVATATDISWSSPGLQSEWRDSTCLSRPSGAFLRDLRSQVFSTSPWIVSLLSEAMVGDRLAPDMALHEHAPRFPIDREFQANFEQLSTCSCHHHGLHPTSTCALFSKRASSSNCRRVSVSSCNEIRK